MINSPFKLARIPTLHFGAGKLKELPKSIAIFGKKALIVTGTASLKGSEYWQEALEGLRQAEIEFQTLTIDAEPSTEFIDSICASLKGQGIEVVIGIGGGSVIDGAKAISAMLPHTNSVLDHLEDVGKNVPHSGIKIPYIAVPTTSGTGGEMTKNAVMSMVGLGGYKKSLRHDNLIPDTVIIDPRLMLSCPPHITAACGMDAFTQLLEAYLSPLASPLTDALAISGLEEIADCLVAACTDGQNKIAIRSGMAYASMLSGIVLANAGLGIVHGLASPIGGFFPMPHGVVCGTLVASATETNLQALQKRLESQKAQGSDSIEIDTAITKFAQVGKIFYSSDPSQNQKFYCDFLVKELYRLTDLLQVPRLGYYGIKASDLDRIIEKTSNRQNPIQLNSAEIHEILFRRL